MKHLLNHLAYFSKSRDEPHVAVAYCGAEEECTGSGRHNMAGYLGNSTCDKCSEAWMAIEQLQETES